MNKLRLLIAVIIGLNGATIVRAADSENVTEVTQVREARAQGRIDKAKRAKATQKLQKHAERKKAIKQAIGQIEKEYVATSKVSDEAIALFAELSYVPELLKNISSLEKERNELALELRSLSIKPQHHKGPKKATHTHENLVEYR